MTTKISISTFACSISALAICFNTFANDIAQKRVELLKNERFETIKNTVFKEPYKQLPQFKVKLRYFGSAKKNGDNKLLNAANRTFNQTDDLIVLETKQKLLNPNGICFSGSWKITEDNQYTGLFKKGVTSPLIVRASTALSGTTQKSKRSFGMGIKLLPNDLEDRASLNAFVFHSITGTVTKNVLDLELDNEPPLGSLPPLTKVTTALRMRRDLENADKNNGATKPDATYRPVNNLAQYRTNINEVVAPRWLKLTALTTQRVDQDDFRDELRVENYVDKKISYQIDVAGNHNDKKVKKTNAQWQTIGTIELSETITSSSCDLNLHFQHPRYK